MANEFARGLVAFGDPFLKALISGQQGQREDRKLDLLEETRRGNLEIAQEELLLKQDTSRLAREKFEQENQSFQSGMQLFQGLMRGGGGGQFKATEDKAIGDLSRLKDGIPLAQQATNILEKGNPQDLNDALSEVNNKLEIAKKINRAPTREDKNRIIREAFNDSAAKNNGRPDMRFAQMINMNDDQLEATNLLSEGQNNQLQTIIQNKISQNQSREDRFFDVFTENEFELRSAFGGSKRGREFLSSVVDPTLKRIGEGRVRRETPTTEIGKINAAEKAGRITPEQARIRREQILTQEGFEVVKGPEGNPVAQRNTKTGKLEALPKGFLGKDAVAEKATFAKSPGVIVELPDGTFAQSIPVIDTRTGKTVNKIVPLEGQPVSRLGETGEQLTARKIRQAGGITRTKAQQTRIQVDIDDAISAAKGMAVVNRSIKLLDDLKTGGFDAIKVRIKQTLGVESANEAELTANLGKQVLAQLRPIFGSQFTEREGATLTRIEAGFGKSTKGNIRLLNQLKQLIQRSAKRGIAAAKDTDDFRSALDIQDLLEFTLQDVAPETITEGAPGGIGAGEFNFNPTTGKLEPVGGGQ